LNTANTRKLSRSSSKINTAKLYLKTKQAEVLTIRCHSTTAVKSCPHWRQNVAGDGDKLLSPVWTSHIKKPCPQSPKSATISYIVYFTMWSTVAVFGDYSRRKRRLYSRKCGQGLTDLQHSCVSNFICFHRLVSLVSSSSFRSFVCLSII